MLRGCLSISKIIGRLLPYQKRMVWVAPKISIIGNGMVQLEISEKIIDIFLSNIAQP
jgi:hypothetical protein